MYTGGRYSCPKCHEKFHYPNCLRAHMRFRCKFRQQTAVLADANNRRRQHADAPLQSDVKFGEKLPAKRKRVDDDADTRQTETGSAPQPGVEMANGVENATSVDTSAFQRVHFAPPSPTTSGPTLMTSSAPMTTDGAAAGLFLFPGLVAAPPPRLPSSFPTELHPVNGLNNNNNNETGSRNKMAAAGGRGGAMVQPDSRIPLPFVYRAPNPVIDKMLNFFGSASAVAAAAAGGPALATSFPSLNLAQNWCAKCNTSFRMTSDLVYHMRSHHKREFDPVKRRKDDKLRCEVCGESFRERHHLTRHMTSHS